MLALRILSEAGPDSSLSGLLLWVLGFFFLMVIVGWLASRNKGSTPEVRHKAHEHDAPVKSAPKVGRRK